ncbi:MAG: monovalent cation/H+ antiporter subunit D family protein [Pseudomonadota bacterium]
MLPLAATDTPAAALTLAAQLPGLRVVVPILGAIVCALLQRGTLAFVVAMLTTFSMLPMAFGLLAEVQASGAISYRMGGWEPPFGIEYRVDALNVFVLLLLSIVASVTIPFARKSVAVDVDSDKHAWFYALYLLCLAGLTGMAITGDAFNVFVFMEISSLAAYILIAIGQRREAFLSAYQYLIVGTIGATFYVIGIGFLYSMTGTLNLVDIAARLSELGHAQTVPPPLLAALAFIFVGIALKLALFPLHAWLPGAYAHAPSFVTVFLSATATKVAVYLLVRFVFVVFPAEEVFARVPFREILMTLSIAGMIGASLVAIFQEDVKRMFAYSSVAQIGYMTLGIALANEAGLTGGIVHLFNHGITKAAAFIAVGAVFYRIHSSGIDDWSGIGRKMPLTCAALAVAGLSLIGSPGTVGFISKWNLAVGALELGYWWLVVIIMSASMLAVIYVGRVLEIVWLRQPVATPDEARPPPATMMVPLIVLGAAIIWFGIDTTLTADLAREAARFALAPAGPQP